MKPKTIKINGETVEVDQVSKVKGRTAYYFRDSSGEYGWIFKDEIEN
jgi:hypothetical protein